MKRLLLPIMFLMGSLACQAQSSQEPKTPSIFSNPTKVKPDIVSDDVAADGTRTIICTTRLSSYKTVGLLGQMSPTFQFHVTCTSKDGVNKFHLTFRLIEDYKLECLDNSPLLIKLADGSTYSTTIDHGDSAQVINETVTVYPNVRSFYKIFIMKDIDDDFLDTIANGVKKFRFEVNGAPYDVELKKDNFSDFVIQSCQICMKALSTAKDFESGF